MDIGQIVLALNDVKTVFLSRLFTTIVCSSQLDEILTNSVSARKRSNCLIFGFFAIFGGRRRRNEKWHRPECFSAERQLD